MKILLLGVLTSICLPLLAADKVEDRFAKVSIKTHQLTDQLYMLEGSGGNIGVSAGEDGLLMIDDQFAPLATKIKTALKALGSDKPKYLLNTHYHGDHTGSNGEFGNDSTIVAHDNVRSRLISNAEAKDETIAPESLPSITFENKIHLYFNGEEIQITHMPNGHTDGDAIVYFTKSNVLHLGDHYFKDIFPYVDLKSGGSVQGLINNIQKSLNIAKKDTQIIPGHGAMANRSDLSRYFEMLKATSAEVNQQLASGKTVDQITAAGLDKKWAKWGAGFINEARWIATIAASQQSN